MNNNMPVLKEGAAQEAKAYTLPGELMNQYNQQFGGTFGGASAVGRLNSVLGRLGNQFSLMNLTGKIANNQGARMGDMAKSIADQYNAQIQALQSKYQMLTPLYQAQLSQEEAARSRAAAYGGGGGGGSYNLPPMPSTNLTTNQTQVDARNRARQAAQDAVNRRNAAQGIGGAGAMAGFRRGTF